jgi:zinc protease
VTAFDKAILSNGLTFLYRRSPGVPLAAGTLLLRCGTRDEPSARAGLASLTVDLMLQGTRRRNARRIANEIESVGASLGAQASEDYTEVGFTAPVAHLDRILHVLAEILTEPAFSQPEITKEREQVLASLKSRKDSIFNFAYDHFNQTLYGDHAYGRPIDGKPETVRQLTRPEFQAWHRAFIQPRGAVFSMVGSLPFTQARQHAERTLRHWKSRAPAPLRQDGHFSEFKQSRSTSLHARFEQAYYMTGMQAPSVLGPDYMTLKVLNTVLGGGMSSRLFLRLREDLGLAYEVSSFFPTHLLSSQWVIYLGLPPQKLPVARRELKKILDALERQGPRREEVQQAIAMIKGSYVMEHQTRRRQAWYAAWWHFLGREGNPDQQFLSELKQVTPQRTHALARRLLSQPRVTVEVAPVPGKKRK